ncbi:DNA topoisomerase 1-like [Aedes albopictus]|uniref:ZAD domain-containing protein n=1 Tax=Aedes albopictus TaxID=7160 RepID=A0ABM1ZJI5_AEDAL
MDSGSSHRARRSRAAEVCRLCLKKRYLVDIDCNQYLCMQLKECFPQLSPDDSELPRFVCGECYQLVEITYQFIIRTRRTEVLLRSYVHMGGDFPNQEALEAEYRRRPKRSASPEKDSQEEKPASKKRRSSEESSKSTERRSSKSKKDNERNSSKHKEEEGKDSSKHGSKRESTKHNEKDSSEHKHKSNRSSSSSKRKEKDVMLPTKAMAEAELKRYYNSDEYLFGGAVDLEPVKVQNDRVEEIQSQKDVAIRMESVASHLKGISLEMSYEEMANVLAALQTIQNGQTVSM